MAKLSKNLIPKIDKELREVRNIDIIQEKQNMVISYKMLILGIIIGIFGNVIASALWEPPTTDWRSTIVILSIIILLGTIIYFYEQLRKYKK